MKSFGLFFLLSLNFLFQESLWRLPVVHGFSSSNHLITSTQSTADRNEWKNPVNLRRYGKCTMKNADFQLKSSRDMEDTATKIWDEILDIGESIGIAASSIPILKRSSVGDSKNLVQDILELCDQVDALDAMISPDYGGDVSITPQVMLSSVGKRIRKGALQYKRYEMLVELLKKDYPAYVTTASFLSPSRLSRWDIPNAQDVPYDLNFANAKVDATEIISSSTEDASRIMRNASALLSYESEGAVLVPDCSLDSIEYKESLLDQLLLYIFRKLVTQNTGGVTSSKSGILGLLDQGRTFMLQANQTSEAQHTMVQDTLAGLMTPVLPPFYRIFMSGIVPKLGTPVDGKQYGPWFYAPFLTSMVTPTFFGFLVGPSYPNRRKDGEYGGLLVEKCKFLQESNCKGLCLHQCKLPAQQFFSDTLGLPLTVSPNFVTQECQWSFGEVPLPVTEDASFPKGCLTGCESRRMVNERRKESKNLSFVDLCSS
jgi:Beta-carotene isomerase D27-like, C-terminal